MRISKIDVVAKLEEVNILVIEEAPMWESVPQSSSSWEMAGTRIKIIANLNHYFKLSLKATEDSNRIWKTQTMKFCLITMSTTGLNILKVMICPLK